MTIGVKRCTEENCNGIIVYKDDKGKIKEPVSNGEYIANNELVCDTCGSKFKALYCCS